MADISDISGNFCLERQPNPDASRAEFEMDCTLRHSLSTAYAIWETADFCPYETSVWDFSVECIPGQAGWRRDWRSKSQTDSQTQLELI
jgi:hypothetical protein